MSSLFPAGDVTEPFVDADDIADVALAALTDDRHDGQTYHLTGPRLLTYGDAAAEIARASGREIRYIPVTQEDYAAVLREHVPAEYVAFLTEMFVEILDGHNSFLEDGVQRVLGRKPRDFRDYALGAAKAGAWKVPG